jgi:hypothetical protein
MKPSEPTTIYDTTMAATGNNHAPSNNSNSAPNIVRRRDKRRHISPNSLDLRNSFDYVALAIRFDESRPESEQLLQTPLEDGRLYDNSMSFTQALEYLQKKTAPPARLLSPQVPFVNWQASAAHKRKVKADTMAPIYDSQASVAHKRAVRAESMAPTATSSSNLAVEGQIPSRQNQMAQYRALQQQPRLTAEREAALQQQTQPQETNRVLPHLPPVALTPIILSGLLAAIKDEQVANTNSNSNNNVDTSNNNTNSKTTNKQQNQDTCSELVLYCLSMRRAALHRVRHRRQRHVIQRIVLPIGSLLLLICVLARNLHVYMQQLHDLSYIESCDATGKYRPACRLSEGHLHKKYRTHLLHLREAQRDAVNNNRTFACPGTDCWHEVVDHMSMEAPFALHTALRQDLISVQEVDAPHPSTWQEGTGYFNRRVRTPGIRYVDKSRVKWLGNTVVNRLVRLALDEFMPQAGLQRRILDVGCGVAGSFFTLYQPPPPLSEMKQERPRAGVHYKNRLVYTGITNSQAEATMARELILLHNITNLKDVKIDVKSFDDPLPRGFTATIAIESLSYSRHMMATLNNLMEATIAGGILIVVDDVVVDLSRLRHRMPAEKDPRPSLMMHKEWMAAFDHVGCEVILMRDLSLEYELMGDPSLRPETAADGNSFDWLIPYWLVENWMKRSRNAALRRVAEMHEDRAAAVEAYAARRQAYADSNMGYHMYVCRKARIDF